MSDHFSGHQSHYFKKFLYPSSSGPAGGSPVFFFGYDTHGGRVTSSITDVHHGLCGRASSCRRIRDTFHNHLSSALRNLLKHPPTRPIHINDDGRAAPRKKPPTLATSVHSNNKGGQIEFRRVFKALIPRVSRQYKRKYPEVIRFSCVKCFIHVAPFTFLKPRDRRVRLPTARRCAERFSP